MTKHVSKAGKHLIQILMFSMYNDQRIIYREYVQNSFDAINRAVKKGVLNAVKDGIVAIDIDSESRCITIKDNGCGIPSEEVEARLLNIADSKKTGIDTAGQYGIGRLAGAGYCKWLRFKTSVKGENISTTITFDVDFANKLINDTSNTYSATEIIDACTSVQREDEDSNLHYFKVELDGVYTEYKDLLNQETIIEYLREVAPIDYTMEFKNTLMKPSLIEHPDYRNFYDQIGHVTISVNNTTDIRKRYKLKIEGTGDEIDCLDFFKVEHPNGEILAWGWYAVTPFTKQIPSSDPSRGIRLRQFNIQLGSCDTLNRYFGETRSNYYFYGEIFAIHPNLRPNSDRSGLAPTPETEVLFSNLRKIFKNLDSLYRLANNAKNAAKKVVLAVDKLSLGIETDQQHIAAEIQTAEQELNKVEEKAQSPVAQRVVKLHKAKADEKKHGLQQIPGDHHKGQTDNGSHTKQSQNTQSNANQPTTDERQTAIPPKNTGRTGNAESSNKQIYSDILEPLKEKFTEKEIMLIRRTFAFMSQHCPEAHKELLDQLKRHAIKQLITL